MKKIFLILAFAVLPGSAHALNTLPINQFGNTLQIPSVFLSSSKTESLEWGCPVADVVKAKTTAEAMAQIGQACMDDVRKAAKEKPGVFDVIRVSVVWPDVQISSTRDGLKMEGTIFLETVVMKGQEEAR
jgi:hypothetical protein